MDKPLTEEEIRSIVKNEMQRNYQSGSPFVAPQAYTGGADGLQVNSSNVIGFNPISAATRKIANPDTQSSEYGFASMLSLIPGDSTHAAQSLHNTSISMYPVIIVQGNGASVQGTFNGGWAPDGTLIFFDNGDSQSILYIRSNGIWRGVSLTLMA